MQPALAPSITSSQPVLGNRSIFSFVFFLQRMRYINVLMTFSNAQNQSPFLEREGRKEGEMEARKRERKIEKQSERACERVKQINKQYN